MSAITVNVICDRLAETLDDMLAALRLGTAMREAQALYFKTRDRSALLASKEIERAFDMAVAAAIAKATDA